MTTLLATLTVSKPFIQVTPLKLYLKGCLLSLCLSLALPETVAFSLPLSNSVYLLFSLSPLLSVSLFHLSVSLFFSHFLSFLELSLSVSPLSLKAQMKCYFKLLVLMLTITNSVLSGSLVVCGEGKFINIGLLKSPT